MTTKPFKGKAIYNPSGKAGEYSYWACNFYTGCSNDCDYCYCKRGVMSSVWSTEPQLKKGLVNNETALEIFKKELLSNIEQLKQHGLFFSFTTDPMLESTYWLTMSAVNICLANDVPVKILTKCTRKVLSVFFGNSVYKDYYREKKHLIAIGFTLTGHDELEKGASTNEERIEVMKMLHDEGFITFASIEPVIDYIASLKMILKTSGYCDQYKIGLESRAKITTDIKKEGLKLFCEMAVQNACMYNSNTKIYFKESINNPLGHQNIFDVGNVTKRDYNLFKQ